MTRCTLLFLSALAAVANLAIAGAAERTGQQIYAELCAKCHGANGEGTDENYPDRLAGNLSVGELTKLIDKTMPFEEPEKCSAEESQKVAAYIYETFYSPLAQERNRPARIELARLTVRQYQNAVTDLVGSFRPAAQRDPRQGLRAEYYKNRRFRDEDKVLERLDANVDFDFGTDSPAPGEIEDYEFSIRWEGTIFAPETGDYDFVIRTEHAARLWINDLDRTLIDAWVKSGNDTEYRATLRLLGGRTYPIQMEFSKAKQGVDDSKKQKERPKSLPASIRLCWRMPHSVEQPVPSHCFSPSKVQERLVLATAFPPDDRSVGYEKGTAISKEWENATTDAALEVAGYVANHFVELAGIREARRADIRSPGGASLRRRRSSESEVPDSPEVRDQKLRDFSRHFVERAFRRPLTSEEEQFFIDRHFTEAKQVDIAIKRIVLLALKSPRFLYREVSGTPTEAEASIDPYSVASRLSFTLWDSIPDEELLLAAAAGDLANREQVQRHAERMLEDERTRSKLRAFFLQWLKVDQPPEIAKDPERFPEFTEQVAADLRTSLDLFLDAVVWSDKSDFRELLQADWLYLNGRLAQLYRPDLPPDAPFIKLALNPDERAGIFTHPYLMAGFAYTATSSPIHRGVFIARSVLGRTLRPPPEAVAPLPVELHAGLTTRERIALQTKPQACQSCHAMINPLGFTLENFDAVGRFRDDEAGKPIDTRGAYRTRTGDIVRFKGVQDLADFLATSEETHAALVEQLFHNLVKQPVRAYGPQMLPDLQKSFAAGQFNIRRLAVDIALAAALAPGETQ
jgi:hypothetical protein